MYRSRRLEHHFVLVVVSALFLTTSTARSQSDSDQGLTALISNLLAKISLLEDRIKLLEERIARLEAGEASNAPPPPSSDSARIMQVESIEPLPPDSELLKEAAALEVEADVCDRKAEEARELERKFTWDPNRRWKNEDDEQETELEYRRLRAKYRKEAARQERDAKIKRARAESLRADAHAPQHLIRGWDGRRVITLRTTGMASRNIDQVRIDGFIEWTGMPKSADADFEIWHATRISVVSRPDSFKDRAAATAE